MKQRRVIKLSDLNPEPPVSVSLSESNGLGLESDAGDESKHKDRDGDSVFTDREQQIVSDEALAKEMARIEEEQAKINAQRKHQQQALAARLMAKHRPTEGFAPQVQIAQVEGKDLWGFVTDPKVQTYAWRPMTKSQLFEVAFLDRKDSEPFLGAPSASAFAVPSAPASSSPALSASTPSAAAPARSASTTKEKDKDAPKSAPMAGTPTAPPAAPKMHTRTLPSYMAKTANPPSMGCKPKPKSKPIAVDMDLDEGEPETEGDVVPDLELDSPSNRIWRKQLDRYERSLKEPRES
jgi:hypothetical protein